MKSAVGLLATMRPQQWTKNVFVFAALLFSRSLFDTPLLIRAAIAFGLFCLISGAVYTLNDLVDRHRDRRHPVKARRPIAAGVLPVAPAIAAALLLAAGSLAGAVALSTRFAGALAAYACVQVLYTVAVKHVVILDVLFVALGFVIRVAAGALVIDVEISSWLLICSTLIALFLALCKRRHELTTLGESAAGHRRVLADYTPYFLDQMIVIVAAATLIGYALYTVSEETITKFGTSALLYTLPFVIYGIFRYMFLVHHRREGGSPEYTLLTDAPLVLDILLWALAAGVIVYR